MRLHDVCYADPGAPHLYHVNTKSKGSYRLESVHDYNKRMGADVTERRTFNSVVMTYRGGAPFVSTFSPCERERGGGRERERAR